MSILTLIIKDFKIVISDRKAMIILIAMPIILFSILSVALSSTFNTDDNKLWDINLAIVKLYDIDEEIEIIEKYASEYDINIIEFENILFDILDSEELSFINYEFMTLEEAKLKIDNNELTSIMVLPEHYVSNMFINMSKALRKPVDIRIIKNTDIQYSSEISINVIKEISNQLSNVMITNKVIPEVLNYYDQSNNATVEVRTDELDLTVKEYKIEQLVKVNSAQYYSVAMMAMFLLFGASYGAKFMLVEKKEFTLQRQQMSGIKTSHLVFGKMVIIFLVAILQIFLMIFTSHYVFKVEWGNPLYVFALTLLVAFGVMGMGSIIAGISLKMDSLKAINILESGIFQFLALFGGSYFPIYLMPSWFQSMSKLIINGAALDGYLKIMMRVDLVEIIPSLISIFVNGIVFLIIGAVLVFSETKSVSVSETKSVSEEVLV